jgi:hypothetical protein
MIKHTHLRTGLRWLGPSLALLLSAACTRSSTSNTSSEGSSFSVPSNSRTVYSTVVGEGNLPGFSVEAPFGWSANGNFVTTEAGGGLRGISVWTVGDVPRNPCHSIDNTYDPGPTVGDLATAFTKQPMRHATDPTDARLAGYAGKYLEWSVPTSMVVTGDADFKTCDVQDNGHRDFVSWLGNAGGERYEQMAGQVDRLWILDVNGQRLLVDATYSPDTTPTQRDEEDQVVRSLRFVEVP